MLVCASVCVCALILNHEQAAEGLLEIKGKIARTKETLLRDCTKIISAGQGSKFFGGGLKAGNSDFFRRAGKETFFFFLS